MNFLAHIFLSGEENDLLKLGNFMGDTIRGKQYLDYPEEVQRGILLHRQIDTFTDAHPLFRESKRRLVPLYGHYAGVITDIFYDYFLTKRWRVFSSEDFDGYIERFYALLQEKKEVLNPQMQYAITSLQTEEPLFEAEFLPVFKEIQEFVIAIDK